MRAFTELWDRICRERYGVTDPKARRFRYGVQVNSLGLTEAQPENNVQRIVLEALGVTLSKRGPGPVAPAPGLERGPGAAPPVGPAVVAAHPTGAGLRDRPARVRRPLRRLGRGRGPDRRADRRRPSRAGRGARAGRRVRGHRRAQGPAGALPHRTAPSPRVRRPHRGGRERLHRDRRVAPGRRGQHPQGRSRGAGRDDRRRRGVASRARHRSGRRSPSRPGRRAPRAPTTSCRPPSPWPRPAAPPANGPTPCARSSASTGPPPASPPRSGPGTVPPLERARAAIGRHRRRAAQDPGGQAGPRRALQRRRADRRGGPRRGHGGRLPGHPPDPRADRRGRPGRGRRRDRPVDPVGQPPRARARRDWGSSGPRGSTPRSWSAASSPRTIGSPSRSTEPGPSTPRRTSISAASWPR